VGDTVKKGIVCNHRNNSMTAFFNVILCISDKFYIIIIKIYFLFIQIFLIICKQATYPFPLIHLSEIGIRRIPNHHHHRHILFDEICFAGLSGKPSFKQGSSVGAHLFQTVCEKNSQPVRIFGFVSCFGKQKFNFQMRHCIRGHEDFKTVQSRYQIRLHIPAPDAFLSSEFLMNLFYHAHKKGSGSCCGIKNLNPVNLFFLSFRIGQIYRCF